MAKNKTRLDVALVEKGLAESREKAKAIIMSGIVYVNNQKSDKAGKDVSPDDTIEVRGKTLKYVSRGGLKLEKAMECFPISLDGKICMDVGASTVVNLERTNFRYVTDEQIKDKIDFSSVDVSFISLKHILPNLNKFLKDDGSAVCLIKPQFEAGREKVGKKGVVSDPATHLEVCEKVNGLAVENGFSVAGLDFSPIKGPEGNIEYLIYLLKSTEPVVYENVDAKQLVYKSHEEL